MRTEKLRIDGNIQLIPTRVHYLYYSIHIHGVCQAIFSCDCHINTIHTADD